MLDGLDWTAAHEQPNFVCFKPKESTKETIDFIALVQRINDDNWPPTKLPCDARYKSRKMHDIFECCITLIRLIDQFINDLTSSGFESVVPILVQ